MGNSKRPARRGASAPTGVLEIPLRVADVLVEVLAQVAHQAQCVLQRLNDLSRIIGVEGVVELADADLNLFNIPGQPVPPLEAGTGLHETHLVINRRLEHARLLLPGPKTAARNSLPESPCGATGACCTRI